MNSYSKPNEQFYSSWYFVRDHLGFMIESIHRRWSSYSYNERFGFVIFLLLSTGIFLFVKRIFMGWLRKLHVSRYFFWDTLDLGEVPSGEFTLIVNAANRDVASTRMQPETLPQLRLMMIQYENMINAASNRDLELMRIRNPGGSRRFTYEEMRDLENKDEQFVRYLWNEKKGTEPLLSLRKGDDPLTWRFVFLKDTLKIRRAYFVWSRMDLIKYHLEWILSRFDLMASNDRGNMNRVIYQALPNLVSKERIKACDSVSINGIRDWGNILRDIQIESCILKYNLPSDSSYRKSKMNPQGITVLRSIMDTYWNAVKGKEPLQLTNYYWIDNGLLREGIDPNESKEDKERRENKVESYIDNMRSICSYERLFELEENSMTLQFSYLGNDKSLRDVKSAKKHLNLIVSGYSLWIKNPNQLEDEVDKRDHDLNEMLSIERKISDDLDKIIRANSAVESRVDLIYSENREISTKIEENSFDLLKYVIRNCERTIQYHLNRDKESMNGKVDSKLSGYKNDEIRRFDRRLINKPWSNNLLFRFRDTNDNERIEFKYQGGNEASNGPIALIHLGVVLDWFEFEFSRQEDFKDVDLNNLREFFGKIRSNSFPDVIDFTSADYRNSIEFVSLSDDDESDYKVDELSNQCVEMFESLMNEYSLFSKGGKIEETRVYHFDEHCSLRNGRKDNEDDTAFLERISFIENLDREYLTYLNNHPLFVREQVNDRLHQLRYLGSDDKDAEIARMQIKWMRKKLDYWNVDNPYGTDSFLVKLWDYVDGFLLKTIRELPSKYVNSEDDDTEENQSVDRSDGDYEVILNLPDGKDSKDSVFVQASDMIRLRLTMEDYRRRMLDGEKLDLPDNYSDRHWLKHESLKGSETSLNTDAVSSEILFELEDDEKRPWVVRFRYTDQNWNYLSAEAHLRWISAWYGVVESMIDDNANGEIDDFIKKVKERLYYCNQFNSSVQYDRKDDGSELNDDRDGNPSKHDSKRSLKDKIPDRDRAGMDYDENGGGNVDGADALPIHLEIPTGFNNGTENEPGTGTIQPVQETITRISSILIPIRSSEVDHLFDIDISLTEPIDWNETPFRIDTGIYGSSLIVPIEDVTT